LRVNFFCKFSELSFHRLNPLISRFYLNRTASYITLAKNQRLFHNMKLRNYCIYTALAAVFCFFGEKATAQTYNLNTTSGAANWTVPEGVFCIQVECWGGGGNGGRSTSNGQATGGGGGGAYARLNYLAVTPGQVIPYFIGAGGSGAGGANSGGDTWFSSNTTVMAKGGTGVANNTTVGGSGGQASVSIGDVKYNGGNGGTGSGSGGCAASGGGGGGAGSTGIGNPGNNGVNGTGLCLSGGSGGSGGLARIDNGGSGGNGATSEGPGGNGQLYGAGGGGAKKANVCVLCSNQNGGSGARGMIRIIVVTTSVAPTVITGTTTICSGSSTTLTVSGGTIGAGAEVQWFTGSCGGTSAGTGNSITVSPGSTTTYFVRYSGTCNTTTCASVTVTVNTESTPVTTLSNPGTICPNTNTSITASGGVAGSGSTINWYTGPNGTGTLVGTGTIVTVAPTTNTTYYARREGTCNTTADASVTVNVKNFVYALNGTTSNTYCTDNAGWNHFFVGDDIIFSVQGDLSGAAPGFPVASIADNGAYYQETQGPGTAPGCSSNQQPGEERFEMERSWNVDLGGAPIGTYDIRFYFQPAERAAIEAAAAAWMAAYPDCGYTYKYATPNGFYWFKNSGSNYVAPMFEDVQYTSTPGTTSNGVNYAQWTGITGFSGGSGGIILVPIDVLPVELTSFTALCNSTNDDVSVRWTTASEHNSSHFNVERSTDGSSWDLMTTTNAAGNSTITQVYEVKDFDVRAYETIYYRLQQFDQDGASKQYGPVSVSCSDGQNSWEVFPNPAGNEVTILLKGDYAAEFTQIHITDINGKSMQVIQYEQGQLITVDLRSYAPGVYIVRLKDGEQNNQFVRLVKQ
jgi:hypothetical protein